MNAKELKKKSKAMLNDIEKAMLEDSEWTSPSGNGVNAFEAVEAARAFNKLIQKLT